MRILRIATVSALGIAAAITFANPASATGTLDQSYTVDAMGSEQIDATHQLAQVFTAGTSGNLDQIDLKVLNYWVSGPDPDLELAIRSTAGGLPSNVVLATASVPRVATQNTPPTWVTFNLSSRITVVSGTQYAIVLTSSAATNLGYGWEVGFTSLYPAGSSLSSSNGGATWLSLSGETLDFKTYVSASSAADGPVPAPVFQAFGKPSSGTCDAAAPIALNWGGAGSGSWGNSWAEWMNGGKGGPVCTRTLSYSNALGHWVAS